MFKFFLRLLKHLAILLFLSLPLMLLGILLIPFILLAIGDNSKFPSCFKWLDNADHWLNRNSETYDNVIKQGLQARYIWLAFRNPTNYFGYVVLGFTIKELVQFKIVGGSYGQQLILYSIRPIGDGQYDREGSFFIEYNIDGITRYEYYYIKKYTIFGQTKCIRFRMGYKLGTPNEVHIGDNVQQVLVFSPYHSYSSLSKT